MMGKSASGKDSIYKRLLRDTELKKIVIYTTRPIRSGEKEGLDYHFVSNEEYEGLKASGRMIEEREYPSALGPWHYFTMDDGGIDLERCDHLGIGTLESYLRLREYYGRERVFPIYIEVEDGERLSRALNRERKEKEPKYREMCRRFLADSEDFSEEKIFDAGITKRFVNDDLERCCREIREFIANGYKGQ